MQNRLFCSRTYKCFLEDNPGSLHICSTIYARFFALPNHNRVQEMGSNSKQVSEIPIVDLTGLQPSLPSGERWEAAKAAAAAALHTHGCFEAIYPSLSAELREEMLGSAVPELFSLPLESKLRLTSEEPYQGYIRQTPRLAYESMRINATDSPIAVQDFTHLMWPQGNPTFYNATVAFAKPLQVLAEMVQKMILQSLGVEKHHDTFVNSTAHVIMLSHYGVPVNQETKIALGSHLDSNLLSIVCQHDIAGLQVQTAGGCWVNAEPSPNSVHVMAGLSFQAWSNTRVQAPMHRVRMLGNEERFSAIYATRPSDNSVVKSPEELGDDGRRPLLYKPFNYTELVRFMYSEQGLKQGPTNAFNSYCRLEN